ncbi:hypothetical protein L6452_01733 [Arctium lappa]|uniref:Uncharacterized protein n=1 Tax=Arctium lappa TaxID=4217 RepID=A0ACB9FI42_ARCLA|nr:hypothetical protein L6452_01733 [Arctium lappa]
MRILEARMRNGIHGFDIDGIDIDGLGSEGIDSNGIDNDGIGSEGIRNEEIDNNGIDNDGIGSNENIVTTVDGYCMVFDSGLGKVNCGGGRIDDQPIKFPL